MFTQSVSWLTQYPSAFQGKAGIITQLQLIQPFIAAGVKLFVPSEEGYYWDEEEAAAIPWIGMKLAVSKALKAANVPHVRIVVGGYADTLEFLSGVDLANNSVQIFGKGAPMAMWYVM